MVRSLRRDDKIDEESEECEYQWSCQIFCCLWSDKATSEGGPQETTAVHREDKKFKEVQTKEGTVQVRGDEALGQVLKGKWYKTFYTNLLISSVTLVLPNIKGGASNLG